MYRFKGLFEVNEEKLREVQVIIYERIATRVKTYSKKSAKKSARHVPGTF